MRNWKRKKVSWTMWTLWKKEKRAHLAFTAYLEGVEPKLHSLEYWLYEPDTLNNYLARFWLGVRQTDGSKYKLNSSCSLMYGLNKILKCHGFPDIHKNDTFISSRRAFEAAKQELVKDGLGTTQSAPEITEAGQKNPLFSHHPSQKCVFQWKPKCQQPSKFWLKCQNFL